MCIRDSFGAGAGIVVGAFPEMDFVAFHHRTVLFDRRVPFAPCLIYKMRIRVAPAALGHFPVFFVVTAVSYTHLIGDTVNMAQRFQSVALPGQIVISQAAYEQMKESFILSLIHI